MRARGNPHNQGPAYSLGLRVQGGPYLPKQAGRMLIRDPSKLDTEYMHPTVVRRDAIH